MNFIAVFKKLFHTGISMAYGGSLSSTPSRWTSYGKTSGRSTMKGEWFEVKTSGLLYLRGLNSKQDFMLASNVEQARNFDDIVLKYKVPGDPHNWHTCFMQLKHKERARLSAVMLTEGVRGGFSLKKYLKSYSDIKQRMLNSDDELLFSGPFEKCDFVIYTNAKLDRDLADRQRDSSVGPLSNLLTSSTGNDRVVNFCEESDNDIYSAMSGSGAEGKEFLKKLTVFSGQPSEDQMNELIMEELKITCSDHKSDIDMIYRYYIEAVQEWWAEDRVVFLTPKSSLLKNAVDQYKAFTLTSQQKHDYRLKVKFQDFCLDSLKDEFRKSGSLFCVVSDPLALKLSCTKVLQVLRDEKDSYIFLGLDCVLSEKESVLSGWKNGRKRFLVIVSESSTEHAQLSEEIIDILREDRRKKLVLLHVPGDSFAKNFKRSLGATYDVYQDTFDVSQLDKESNHFITRKLVMFQSHSVYLKDLFNKCIPQAQGLIANNLSAIVNTDSLTIGSDILLGDVIAKSHALNRHDILSPDILETNFSSVSDTFLVSGVSVNELIEMVSPREIVKVFGSEDKNCHLFVASSVPVDAFNKLSKTTANLHWIEIDKEVKWKMSKGDTRLIRQYIDESSSSSYELTTAADIADRIVLVASSQSAILSDVATKTKMAGPATWVVRLNLDHHIDLLRTTELADMNAISLLLTLLGLVEKTQLERDLFRFSLEQAGNVVIFLSLTSTSMTTCQTQVVAFLTNLLHTKMAKLWINCDQESKVPLENILSTLAFELEDENDDTTFEREL